MAFVKSVYYHTELESRINLRPNQMIAGFDISEVLLSNLRADMEKKCSSDYYVVAINEITEFYYGMIDRNNSTGHAIYRVKYKAYICSPAKDQKIVVKYDAKIPDKLSATNGPMFIMISDEAVPDALFTINQNGDSSDLLYKPENRIIGPDDYLLVQVERTQYTQNEKTIIVGAKLLGLATAKEIKEYHKQERMILDPEIAEYNDSDYI